METLRKQISAKVTKGLPHLLPAAVEAIVTHLVSENVGVTSIEDLRDVTVDMLPSTLPPLKAVQLLKAFAPGPSQQSSGPLRDITNTSTSVEIATPIASTSNFRERVMPMTHEFTFEIPWASMPKTTVDALFQVEKKWDVLKAQATANKENPHAVKGPRAKPKDISDLKLAISKKLVSDYKDFKEEHPGKKLHPGRKIYKAVTTQVFKKFPNCLKDKINQKIVGDGDYSFRHSLEICIENLLRKKDVRKPIPAIIGKGTVGIVASEYQPGMTNLQMQEQIGIKDHLINYHQSDPSDWNWDEILTDTEKTFSLQRDEIVKMTQTVNMQTDAESEEMIEEKAIEKFKKSWPFLFTAQGLRCHHKRLTKRDLKPLMEDFDEKHLDYLQLYLTASSNANTENLKLRLKIEHTTQFSRSVKMLATLKMLCNHFKEDFDNLVIPVEKTILPIEFEWKIPDMTANICIVALDNDPLKAQEFHVCIDKIALVQTYQVADAITALFELCFILDVDYPPELPLLFEFYERFVFGMGITDTKVKGKGKKGKYLICLSDTNRKLINGLEEFEQDLERDL